MPTSVSDHFKLDKKAFLRSEAFDALIEWDTKLFVDPFLLQEARTPEFHGAHDELLKYFSGTIKLIGASKKKDDLPWRQASKRLVFRELGAFGLGYASESISGSGIGSKFSDQLIVSLKEIHDAGVTDPELFELLGLFQEGVGADRISDMTCSILLTRFARYTERVFTECTYKGAVTKWNIRGEDFTLPSHPVRVKSPVLLVPQELLRALPVADDFSDIGNVCAENELLRGKLNQVLGATWQSDVRQYGKAKLRELFLKDPEILRELIDSFKGHPVERYDFSKDPEGEYIWRAKAREITESFPLALLLPSQPTFPDVCTVVEKICEKFQEHIETNGLWEALYGENKKPRHERISQRLFYSVADNYCEANNIDLSRESDAGRGPVDFKLSRGAIEKVVVEVKLSSNPKLVQGFEKQVEVYRKAEKAHKAYYLVLQVTDDEKPIEKLIRRKNELSGDGGVTPSIITIDGTPKVSASKVR